MSLIKTNTAKSAAKDIQLNYTIYFENGMKVGKEGYWGSPEEVKQKIGRYLEAAYGSKIKKIEAADTIEAQDARFNAGDKVRIVNLSPYSGKVGKLRFFRGNWGDVDLEDGTVLRNVHYNHLSLAKPTAEEKRNYILYGDSEAKAEDAKTDWNMEVYKLISTIEKLLKKAQAEGATGPNSYGEVFRNCLKALRGY